MRIFNYLTFLVFLMLFATSTKAQGPALNYLRTIGVINPSVIGEWDHGTSVDNDYANNMIVAGNTRGANIYVQNTDSLAQMTSNGNIHSIFVYKYNTAGGIVFAFTIDKVSNPEVYAISDGGFYLIYSILYQDSIDANPNPSQTSMFATDTSSFAGSAQMVSRFDASGALLWAFRLDLYRGTLGLPQSLSAIDNNQNLVIGGYTPTGSMVNVNPLGSAYPIFNGTGLLLKYNLNGQLVWAKDSVEMIRKNQLGGGQRTNERIAINSKNEIVLACDLDTTNQIIDVNPAIGVHNVIRDSGEVIVATYDSNGNFLHAFNFGKYISGPFSYNINRSDVLRVDSNDNIYLSGLNLYGDFDPDSTKTYEVAQNPVWSIQRDDNFIASFDAYGKLRWVNPVRREIYNQAYAIGGLSRNLGNYGNGRLLNFRLDRNGNQYVAYSVRNKYDLDLGPDTVMAKTVTINVQSNTLGQIVLAQYDSNGTYTEHTILADTTLLYNDYLSDFCIDNSCNFYATGTIGLAKSFTTFPIYSSGNYIPYPIPNGASLESDALALKYNMANVAMPYLVRSKSDLDICEGASGKLFVGSGGNVAWYDSATNGNFLGSGHEFQFPALNANTTYYAQSNKCAGNSPRLAVTINVTTIDATISRSADTLWVAEPNATYQWIDCNTNLSIAGETNQYLKTPGVGSYAVIITKNGCVKQSACNLVAPEGVQNFGHTRSFSIYPNPANNSLNIMMESKEKSAFQIVNAQGARVIKGICTRNTSVDVSTLPKGIYFIQVVNSGSAVFVKD